MQVSELPFPFTGVHQFESSIRAPIGKTWNPETSFKKLIKPKVKTRMGKIIQPIDKSQMFKKQQTVQEKEAEVKRGKWTKKKKMHHKKK